MPNAPLVIVNPTAGGGRAARSLPWLRERLGSRPEARLEVTRRPGDAERLAATARVGGHDRVIAIGGDGTAQEVVNGLLDGGGAASLGLLPVGSGNDLARSLGLPTETATAWRVAMGNEVRPLDVARARNGDGTERWFASAGGIGFDAQVAAAMIERGRWQLGRAGYLLTTLAELRRFRNRRIQLTVDAATSTHDVLLVAIANGQYYGGGMRIAPDARPDDGMLDVCIVGDISRLTAIRQLPNLYRGTHVTHPQVSSYTGRAIEVDGDGDTRIHLDGEPFGSLPLRISLLPAALEVAAPSVR
ncbi:MAG: diacylglycerol/lipid kinase family protein [Acidimicrobiales bacterium]